MRGLALRFSEYFFVLFLLYVVAIVARQTRVPGIHFFRPGRISAGYTQSLAKALPTANLHIGSGEYCRSHTPVTQAIWPHL
jgi:hypothetical protein